MSDAEQPSIEAFAQIYADRTYLVGQLDDAPKSLLELLQQGVAAADTRARELAERDEALRAHYSAIGRGPVDDMAKLEEVTPILERLGMTAELETLRSNIAAVQANPELPVANYYLGLVGETPLPEPIVAAAPQPAEAAAPAATSPETAETVKPKLTILVDPTNNIKINDRHHSLSRELGASSSRRSEAEGRALRADILIFLANNPGKMFKASEIWRGARPGVEFDRETWNLYGKSFFLEGLSFNRKSILVADTSIQRVYKYGITADYDITIERINRRLKVNDNVYTLPNGREVAGRVGQVLWLLERASSDKPATTDAFLKLLPTKERASASKEMLSTLVSQARFVLKDNGVNWMVQRVMTDEKDPESGRRRPGYYLRVMSWAEQQARDNQPSADITSSAEAQETVKDEALSLHEATLLAGFLHFYGSVLTEHGLPEVPYDIFEDLNKKVIETYTNGVKTADELSKLRAQTFDKVVALLEDSDLLNNYVEAIEQEDKDDPRLDLLLHLLEYDKPEHLALMKDLLQAHPEVTVTFDAKRRGYNIVDIATLKAARDDGRPI